MREVLIKDNVYRLISILALLLIALAFLLSALFFYRISTPLFKEDQVNLSQKLPKVDLEGYEEVIKKYR